MIRRHILLIAMMHATMLFASESGLVLKAFDASFMNLAILELPPRYLDDIPMSQRNAFLTRLSDGTLDQELDYVHGWLTYSSDGPAGDFGTSMFYLKLLPRDKGIDGPPLVFVHMPKTLVNDNRNRTFVLERWGDEWRDVTSQMMPKRFNTNMAYFPRRLSPIIDVAPWVRVKNFAGPGFYYVNGLRSCELIWNGDTLQMRKAKPCKLPYDDDMN